MAIALSFMAPLMASLAGCTGRRGAERPGRPVERRWAGPLRAPAAAHPSHAARVLRVVHVLDGAPAAAPAAAGRMVISGRMADVCAELDRLAAREC